MKQLQNLQHTFQDSVMNPCNDLSIAWISASGRATPEIQLSKYSYAYVARLKEVLACDFPAMLVAIGDEQFNQLADEYIKSYPSHYFSLRDFGRDMMNFVLTWIQKNEEKKWLYELSLFEWTLGEAFDAEDDNIFSESDMTSIPAEAWFDLKFTIHSSVQRLNLEWNIPEMWQALTHDNPTEVEAKREISSSWLIWREQLVTRFRSMQKDEQVAFDTIREEGSFNDVCEALANIMNEEDVPLHAASLLKSWITQELISSVK
jgi:hypothetical protein